MKQVETTFRLLASQRRMLVLTALQEHGPMRLPELAGAVAARETGTRRDSVPDSQRHKVEMALRHVHLPKLRDSGVVEDDGARIRLASAADDVLAVLEAAFEA
jgi:hypothetical protein